MKFNSLTNVGLVRRNNEDIVWSGINDFDNLLGVVCDGLGGYRGGSMASDIVVKNIKAEFLNTNLSHFCEDELKDWLNSSIEKSKQEILNCYKNNSTLINMATTMVCALIIDQIAYIFNIGDSRAYFVSSSTSYQITEDQNLLNYMRNNNYSNEKIEIYKDNLFAITQSIDGSENKAISIDMYKINLKKDDFIILTSDGLHNFIKLKDIVKAIINNDDYDNAANILISKALSNNSNDNLSIIILKI